MAPPKLPPKGNTDSEDSEDAVDTPTTMASTDTTALPSSSPSLAEKAQRCRAALITALSPSEPVDTILLSGGLDTSIIADLAPLTHLGLKQAVTVVCTPTAPDEAYARAIAEKHSLKHTVVRCDDPMSLVGDEEGGTLETCVRVLKTFDPMELRNAVVVARALVECKRMGAKVVATGDAADELFAGYSFLQGLSPGKLKRWIARLSRPSVMRFCAGPLAAHLGLKVFQPFLAPPVIDFALTCRRSDLIRSIPNPAPTKDTTPGEMTTFGKYVLREAVPEAYSRWRRKDPIEVGSGTTTLPKLFEEHTDPAFVEAEKARILREDGVTIRDAEHLHYYGVFRRVFASDGAASAENEDQDMDARQYRLKALFAKCGIERYGDDPCLECGFQIDRLDSWFCVTCGAWPARTGSPEGDVQEGDDLDE
ncbi:uncharacterized protein EV422DRAFT_257792 [Fimicolochytrium jonesii]|uniref:uncharacterized protein n=1 Tax=Fimicolochytrium jonesii TaxID=1396493 RepID=UPI0022FE0E04|nr:uncharacterized protein EV422DRAFT_257792 [Fimicolochytrium jonesii]KAI8817165.1 hypothetical protein EV422DRAFT_257792 [Fimicolochytrium jonesii]